MEPAKLHAKESSVLPSTRNPSSPSVRQSVTPIGIILPAVVVSVVFIGCFLMKYIKKHYHGTELANRVTHEATVRYHRQLTNPRTEALELTNVPLPEPPPPYEECVVHGVGLAVEMEDVGSGGTHDPALPDYEEAIREEFMQTLWTRLTQGPQGPSCLQAIHVDTMPSMGDVQTETVTQ